jgi:hypothetical protein
MGNSFAMQVSYGTSKIKQYFNFHISILYLNVSVIKKPEHFLSGSLNMLDDNAS